jgi:hypothetical protein
LEAPLLSRYGLILTFSYFEGQIEADGLEKWLNLLEGYFSIHNFSDRKKITSILLKALPHVKHWWETYWEQIIIEEYGLYVV